MDLNTLNDIVFYWNKNHYTQAICINSLDNLFRDMLDNDKYIELKKVLEGVKQGVRLGESEVITAISIIEEAVTDDEKLTDIACILAGEYLSTDIDVLIKILEYYDWKLPVVKNMFVAWYYKLKGIFDYREQACIVFNRHKAINIIRAVGAFASGLTLPYLFITVLSFMNNNVLTSPNEFLALIVFFVMMFITAFATVVLGRQIKWSLLIRPYLKFKEYKFK